MHIKQIQTRFFPEGQDRNYDKTNCINSINCICNLLNPSLILCYEKETVSFWCQGFNTSKTVVYISSLKTSNSPELRPKP